MTVENNRPNIGPSMIERLRNSNPHPPNQISNKGDIMSKTETTLKQTNSYNENGKLHGTIEVFHRTSEVKSRGEYVNGKKEGLFQFFNQSGSLTQEGTYKNSKKIGEWKLFYPPKTS